MKLRIIIPLTILLIFSYLIFVFPFEVIASWLGRTTSYQETILSTVFVYLICLYAVILAIIGLSESLMTLSLIDEKTKTHGKSNRESIAQGLANVVCGFFSSMGGCAMIGKA